ncbi:N-acetylmuramoyl-L-alanine amidase-like domain-containing protein [Candidatus Coxiella mudrowiae]|uniref:N-acetylmuramoyl-L-alanine amidase-like domain-containing protein n=1 Tax=Candidatus Coxiella mudrowiae TaxID=2054173 RepID=UPI0012FEEC8D|nr:N-acetylmuramoyl-L-alanine amidase-like domain-containing protein [Candidatus Coxiella mudrowiae]
MHSLKLQSLDKRIVFISNHFLGKPYLPGVLGEGEEGQFDETPPPLYRRDYFDCLTLVNTVCALPLALSEKKDDFLSNILAFNYYNAIPCYENRFHFTSVDSEYSEHKKIS